MKQSNTSERLKLLMKEYNIRQVDILERAKPFCKKLNIRLGRNDLSQYVSGKVVPGQDKLTVLGLALGVSETWLMGYDVPIRRNDTPLPEGAIPYTPEPMVNIPLVGSVNCGTPLFAEDNIEGYIPTPESDLQTGETYFWLRAKGDSMINVGIRDGDLLLIRQQADVDNGDIAVVAVNGDEATLKRVKKQENALILQPENPACEPRIFVGKDMERVSIRGRLMQLRKEF